MGGMVSLFGGISGVGNRLYEQKQQDLNLWLRGQQMYMQALEKLANDKEQPDDVREQASQRYLQSINLKPGAKFPDVSDLFIARQVSLPPPPPLQLPQLPMPSGINAPPGMERMLTTPETMQFPAPPPQMMSPLERGHEQALSRQRAVFEAQQQARTQAEVQARQAMREDRTRTAQATLGFDAYNALPPETKLEIAGGPEFNLRGMGGQMPIVGVPEVVSGSDLPVGMTSDSSGNPIDRTGKKFYRTARQGNQIVFAIPVVGGVHTSQVVPDSNSPTGFSRQVLDRAGNEVQRLPNAILPSMLPTISQGQQVVQIETEEGPQLYAYPTTTTTQKVMPGGTMPTLPGAPTAPVPGTIPPGSNAPGGAPPSPPTGERKPVKIGEKPLTQQERQTMNNAVSGLKAVKKIRAMLKKDPKLLLKAAIPGSPFAREFDAARKEATDVITRLRTGAALNEEEQKFYGGQLPTALDLLDPAAIEYKLGILEGLFSGLASRKKPELPSEQRSQSEQGSVIRWGVGPDGRPAPIR